LARYGARDFRRTDLQVVEIRIADGQALVALAFGNLDGGAGILRRRTLLDQRDQFHVGQLDRSGRVHQAEQEDRPDAQGKQIPGEIAAGDGRLAVGRGLARRVRRIALRRGVFRVLHVFIVPCRGRDCRV